MGSGGDEELCVAVIGAAGYVGGELLALLSRHENVAQIIAVSQKRDGQKASATHRRLGNGDLRFVAEIPAKRKVDAVFFATPPLVAMEKARRYLDAGATVVDCSPDFRLQDLDVWGKWYGAKHADPELVETAVYGLVELNRAKLPGARLIASPGCYATAVQMAAEPVAKELAAKGNDGFSIIADCVSGTSGAGRRVDRPDLLLAEADGNYQAYAIDGHRHAPEIKQGLKASIGFEPALRFVPHLLPISRGMFATLHFVGADGVEIDLHACVERAYANEVLIDVLGKGISPQIASVARTNRCQIGVASNAPIAMCALDNLGKGAAGQAIQAFNAARGFSETAALL